MIALFRVSTSGADVGGKNWGQLIQTLDRGTFDQKRLLKALDGMKYSGARWLAVLRHQRRQQGQFEALRRCVAQADDELTTSLRCRSAACRFVV